MYHSTGRISFAPFVKAVAGRQDIRTVLEIVAQNLGMGAAFREAYTGRLEIVSSSESFRESAKTFPMLELSRIYYSKDVQVGSVHSGILFLDLPAEAEAAGALSKENEVFFENAVIAASLCLERSFSRSVFGDEKREEVLKELLSGRIRDFRELDEIFRQWGWKKEQDLMVLLLQLQGSDDGGSPFSERERHVFFPLARSKILLFFPKAFCVFFTNMLVFLLPLPSGGSNAAEVLKDTLENIHTSLKEELPAESDRTFLFAAGGIKNGLDGVSESYEEALLTLAVSTVRRNEQAVNLWNMLGGLQLVAILSRTDEARRFCTRVLGELMEGKDASSNELLETLLAMDGCNWNVKAASESLRFHYNTVKYRLGILRERIGFDYSNSAQRFDMALALRLAPFFNKEKFVTIYQKKFI
jgi:sugar diacid utilization regulator